jgi:deazaflavin-dependent oxidoreductase (nitroreductase family)
MTEKYYRRPGWFTRNIANRAMLGLSRLGLSVKGSQVLETRGRRTGEPRRAPVNPLDFEGQTYLVAPRGETDWVKNVRAAGGRLALIRGRRRVDTVATEVADEEKVPLLREYLRRWKAEVGIFFEGVGPDSTDEQIAAISGRHPVFRLAVQTRSA